jgi:exodeoxyribonuclease III
MKIISYNINGIRSAISKGFSEWLGDEMPDIIHLQEIKAMEEQVDLSFLAQLGYRYIWHSAQKKGYSGVASIFKNEPDSFQNGIGIEMYDIEGRFLRMDYGNTTYINSYFPSGTTGDYRQTVKESYLEDVLIFLIKLKNENRDIVISGDFNICHKAIDINNPQRHKNSSGFLPNEREWFDRLISEGFIDSFRLFNNKPNEYSWWSYRANSRIKNLGWRIDYHIVSASLKDRISNAYILQEIKHSDHCPVVIEFND